MFQNEFTWQQQQEFLHEPDSASRWGRRGQAWDRFQRIINAQGGRLDKFVDPDKVPVASDYIEIKAPKAGYVYNIDTMLLGQAAVLLGAGRTKPSDPVDHLSGIMITKKLGLRARKNDVLCRAHAERKATLKDAQPLLEAAFKIDSKKPRVSPIIKGAIVGKE